MKIDYCRKVVTYGEIKNLADYCCIYIRSLCRCRILTKAQMRENT